jgi:hypothetical protein
MCGKLSAPRLIGYRPWGKSFSLRAAGPRRYPP